jgi:hypothetical protein
MSVQTLLWQLSSLGHVPQLNELPHVPTVPQFAPAASHSAGPHSHTAHSTVPPQPFGIDDPHWLALHDDAVSGTHGGGVGTVTASTATSQPAIPGTTMPSLGVRDGKYVSLVDCVHAR